MQPEPPRPRCRDRTERARALAAPRLVLLAPPAYVAVGEAEEFTAMFAGDWPSSGDGVATLQHTSRSR